MFSDQRHMIIAGLDKPVELTIDRDANRENVSSDFVAVRAWIARSTLPCPFGNEPERFFRPSGASPRPSMPEGPASA